MGTAGACLPGWAGKFASRAGPCSHPWDSAQYDCYQAAVGSAHQAEAQRDPQHMPAILTNMKKLKTNIRYFMQLRQSPSMVLHLRNSKAPQASHPTEPLIPPLPHGGGWGCPSTSLLLLWLGKREADHFLSQGRRFALRGQS